MICLSDNDIILHLAAWNLLAEFQAFLQEILHAALGDVYVMTAFVRRLEKGDARWEAQYGKAALDRALRFCQSVKTIASLPHDRSVVVALQHFDAIGPGEAILIAVAHQHPGSLILTNEWRFLSALSTEADCAAYHTTLQGRVVHLRQVAMYFLDTKGHKFVAERVKPQTKSDSTIHRAFLQNAADTRATLSQSVAEVERIGRGMLWSPPP